MTALTPDKAWKEMTVAHKNALERREVLDSSSRRGSWAELVDERAGEVAVPGMRGSRAVLDQYGGLRMQRTEHEMPCRDPEKLSCARTYLPLEVGLSR